MNYYVVYYFKFEKNYLKYKNINSILKKIYKVK